MSKGVLNGKVAIVTGAGSPIGLGHAMSAALVQAGARVAMLDINEDWLAESVRRMREIGGHNSVIAVAVDVSDADAVDEAVKHVIAELGGLDVLVNNAGTTPRAGGFTTRSCNVWEIPVAAWNRVIAVNLNGAFYTIRAALGHMLDQGSGRVVGVTTSLDTMYRKRATPYGPSKAGHEAMLAALAHELDGSGVTANILVPGGRTDTNFFRKMDVDRSELIQPEVMAAPTVWLASDDSGAFNGQRIIACRWDENLPMAERLAKAGRPAAWPQLGQQAVQPNTRVDLSSPAFLGVNNDKLSE